MDKVNITACAEFDLLLQALYNAYPYLTAKEVCQRQADWLREIASGIESLLKEKKSKR